MPRSAISAAEDYDVYAVFTPTQPARLNFVPRPAVNDQLVDALRTPGKQLIVFGESGSGKTSLLLKKLDETYPDHVTTRCHASMTFEQLLLSAFDKLDRYYVAGRDRNQVKSTSGSLSADFLKIRAAIDSNRSSSTATNMERIIPPQLTIQRLGEFMGDQGLCWLVEDFHKMPDEEKTPLAQSLKVFSDLSSEFSGVKIIAIGATETARQVVEYDPEMGNRVSELHVPLMDEREIAAILASGADLLNVKMSAISASIVQYSVGVPSVCHALALNACLEKGIDRTVESRFEFAEGDLQLAANRYVRESSDTLKSTFDRALKRTHVRKYDNARLILSALARGPLSGMLHSEILTYIHREHPKYPASNLTNYLKELQSEKRGPLIRKGTDGRYRFVDPVFHTYAQAMLGIREGRSPQEVSQEFEYFVERAVAKALEEERLPLIWPDVVAPGKRTRRGSYWYQSTPTLFDYRGRPR
jgi:hypothetical protein